MTIDGKTIEIFPSREPGAPLVLLSTFDEEGKAVCEAVRAATEVDFTLAAIGGLNWDDDMTPWPAPPVAKGADPCGGRADIWLETLTGRVLPEIVATLPAEPRYTAIAGYSLGGLFAVYALYRTDAFARAASASGSMWYPGFVEYAEGHDFARRPDCVYLSLGDKEGKTRNPAMSPVEDNTRRLAAWYGGLGVKTTFELNPGGHFRDPDPRMARGIAWMLEA